MLWEGFGEMKMKNKSILALVVVLVSISTVSATIVNDNAPSWRGNDNTTSQAWEFADSSPLVMPEMGAPWNNPYDSGALAIIMHNGGPVAPDNTNTFWMDEHPQYGWDPVHYGVWRIYATDCLRLEIPNDPTERERKEVYIQLTYSASNHPIFSTTPGFSNIELISDVPLDSNYDILTLLITIEPNPDFEVIELRPNDCTMYIDQIIVDTICIPEPITVALLGLGGLLLCRKK